MFCEWLFLFLICLIHADENDVSVVSLDEQVEGFTDTEISDFVSF